MEKISNYITIESDAIGNTGEKIKFGAYDWLVLERQGNMALIITENIIGRSGYYETKIEEKTFDDHGKKKTNTFYNESSPIGWSGSIIRKYLNGEFLEKNFTPEEREKIIYIEHRARPNPWYNESTIVVKNGKNSQGIIYNITDISKSGTLTRDYAFLLSFEEVCRYFGDSMEKLNNGNYKIDGWEYVPRKEGVPPQSEVLNGEGVWWFSDENDTNRVALELEGGKAWNWWLRSDGWKRELNAAIYIDGSVNIAGGHAHKKSWGIRPAMWIRTSDAPLEESGEGQSTASAKAPSSPDPSVPVTAADLIGKWGIIDHVIAEFTSETAVIISGAVTYDIAISGHTIQGKGLNGQAFDLGKVKFILNAEKNAVMWGEGTVTFQYWTGQVWTKIV